MSSSLLSLPGNETAVKNTTISTVGDKKNDAMATTTTTTPIMMIPNKTNDSKSLTKYTATTATAKPSSSSSSSSSSSTTTKTTTSITDWEASVSLAKAIMGAGSFALPWAFSEMGYIAGPIFLIIFLVLSVHSIGLLVECSRWMRRQQQRRRQQQQGTQKTRTITYVDIAQSTFGNNGARLTYIASISASIGVCGSYLVFIAVNLESLFSLLLPLLLLSSSTTTTTTTTTSTTIFEVVEGITSVEGNNDEQHEMSTSTSTSNSSNDVTFLVIIIWTIAMPIAVMLSSVRNPKRFATVSFWGDISVIAGMIAVLIYGTIIATTTIAATSTDTGAGAGAGTGTGYDYTEVNTDDNNNYYDDDNDNDGRNKCVAIGSLHDMALAFGSIGYLFLVHFLILPIESSMLVIEVEHEHDDENNKDVNSNNKNNSNNEKNHHRRFMKIVQRTFTVCGFIGGSFGIAGYLLFGKDTQQIVLMNVVSSDNGSGIGIMATVQFLLCIDLIFTYPVVMRPSIVILEQQLLRRRHRHRRRRQRQNNRTGTNTVTTNTTLSSPSTSPPRLRLSDNRYRSNKRNNVDDDNNNSNSNIISNDNDNDFLDDNEVDIDSDNIEWTTHIIICSILGIIAASAGSFIPAFGLLSGLVGGVSQTFLAIVLPPLMWSKIQQKQKQRSNPTSTFTTSSINSNDAVWASSFYYLPRKEKMLVLCGFGLILWTLHSTWLELN